MSQQSETGEINKDPDLPALCERLVDDFSRTLLAGAIRVAEDEDNPVRGNLFATAIRELFSHTLHSLAPDEEIAKCGWFRSETDDGRPTRAQRQRYLIHGGLDETFVTDELGVELDALRRELTQAFSSINRATHVREGTVTAEPDAVEELMRQALEALRNTLDAVEHCQSTLGNMMSAAVEDETVNTILFETVQAIDEIASHHSIEEIYVDSIVTFKVDASEVWFRAKGTISAELQWGSNSDLRRGDGATLDHDFPFECDIPAFVEAPLELVGEMAELRVTDGGWSNCWYDEEEQAMLEE